MLFTRLPASAIAPSLLLLSLVAPPLPAQDVAEVIDAESFSSLGIETPAHLLKDSFDLIYSVGARGAVVRLGPEGSPGQHSPPLTDLTDFDEADVERAVIDSEGRIYLAGSFRRDDTDWAGVVRLSPQGAPEVVVDSSSDTEHFSPYSRFNDMAVTSDDRLLFLTMGVMYELLPDGEYRTVYDSSDSLVTDGSGRQTRFSARQFTADGAGNVFLSGPVSVQNEQGNFYDDSVALKRLSTLGEIIEVPYASDSNPVYEFKYANDLRLTPLGELLIVDDYYEFIKIKKLAAPGIVTTVITADGDGEFHPWGITPRQNPEPPPASQGNHLFGPAAMDMDAQGNLYVAGKLSNNAFLVQRNGTVTFLAGDDAGYNIRGPIGLKADSKGYIYVLSEWSRNLFKIKSPLADSQRASLHQSSAEIPDRFFPRSTVNQEGTESDDLISANPAGSVIYALAGNDQIELATASYSVFGGEGQDRVVFPFDRGDYVISRDPDTGWIRIGNKAGDTESFIDSEVEVLAFRDQAVAPGELGYWGKLSQVPANQDVPVYRFLNTRSNAFFYTHSTAEATVVLRNSAVENNNQHEWPYALQGATFAAAHTYNDRVPLHRFYNYRTGHHFFTANQLEVQHIIRQIDENGWAFNYEGVAYQVYASDPNPDSEGEEIAVHRFFNPGLNRHFFSADPEEATLMLKAEGWNYEGIGFFADKLEK